MSLTDLRSNRLLLRKLSPLDLPDLYALDQDLIVRRYIDEAKPPAPWPIYEEHMLIKLESFSRFGPMLGFWSARLADGTFLGWLHLRPNEALFPGEVELGYRFLSKYWSLGFATEGARRLLEYATKTLRIRYVMATTLEANAASRRVMEKCGLHWEQAFVCPESIAPFWTEKQRAAVKYSTRPPQ